jgi:hypothetical protein
MWNYVDLPIEEFGEGVEFVVVVQVEVDVEELFDALVSFGGEVRFGASK